MTTDMHTETMVTLGVFDDLDVLPTVVFGVIFPYDGCDLHALLLEMVTELQSAAVIEYGREFPITAMFWQVATREVPNE